MNNDLIEGEKIKMKIKEIEDYEEYLTLQKEKTDINLRVNVRI